MQVPIRAQRGRARSALFSRVKVNTEDNVIADARRKIWGCFQFSGSSFSTCYRPVQHITTSTGGPHTDTAVYALRHAPLTFSLQIRYSLVLNYRRYGELDENMVNFSKTITQWFFKRFQEKLKDSVVLTKPLGRISVVLSNWAPYSSPRLLLQYVFY